MFLVAFMHREGCAFPSPFPCIIHDTSSFETIVGRLFEGRRSGVIIRNVVVDSSVLWGQFYQPLCLLLRDVADLRHGATGWQERMARKRHKKCGK